MTGTIGTAMVVFLMVVLAGHLASLIVLAAPLWYLALYAVLRAVSAPIRKLTANLWVSLAMVTIMAAAYVAPMHGAVVLGRAILGRELQPVRSLDPGYAHWCLAPPSWFWAIVGVCGALYGLWLVFGDGLWHLKMANAVADLPAAKARSAAAGLAEFRGIARRSGPAPSPDAVPPVLSRGSWTTRAWRAVLFRRTDEDDTFELREPFFLQDESGTVLVDTQGASFREPFLLSLFIPFRVREIVLTRRTWKAPAGNTREAWLEEGDRVYVVGQVKHEDDGAGPGRSVVRPSDAHTGDLILRLLGGEVLLRRYRGEPDVFILSDGNEADIRAMLLRRWRGKMAAGVVWAVLSLYPLVR